MKSPTWMWTRIVCSLLPLAWFGLADAQSLPRLKPIPPRGPRISAAAIAARPLIASPWQPLNNPHNLRLLPISATAVSPGAANPLLLTDGSVIVQDAGCQDWWRLTPDNHGSYANGTWTQIASLPSDYSPAVSTPPPFYPDGRVIMSWAGEYNVVDGVFFTPAWTAEGAIYDPIADVWTSVAPPTFFTFIQNLPPPAPP